METKSRFEICQASRAGVLSSLVALASAGSLLGQELPDQQPLTLEELQLLRPLGEACTVTFGSAQDQQILVRSSTDLECWVFAGGCDEINQGSYQFIDLGAAELPRQYYQFESFDPEIQLPPQFEQLRAQLGEEGFAQWLKDNADQSGNLQGIPESEIPEEGTEAREEFDILEGDLQTWLSDFTGNGLQ